MRQLRVLGIEMHGDAAERGDDVAHPGEPSRAQRRGKRLQRRVGLEVEDRAEFGVDRRVAERREPEGLEELLQWICGTATPIMQSRDTMAASFCSLQPPVPAGRAGSTM